MMRMDANTINHVILVYRNQACAAQRERIFVPINIEDGYSGWLGIVDW